ncbi:hypothetical protein HPB50_008714 [Hyalomma asiaticum]|uniref:Uncharacterized protein n=1 Tax=Hyalomma asiaticum TaxID=266040 RepID=A0ACB7TEW6_HYAAI|nr:hypothetical protein HPB50_008714 [Hyalomma asiaticum]
MLRQTIDFIKLRQAFGQSVSSFKAHLDFNLSCKARGLLPRTFRLLRPVATPFGHSVFSRAERQLLQARILECKDTIKRLRHQEFLARRRLQQQCPSDFAAIQSHVRLKVECHAQRTKLAHGNKLARQQPSRPYVPPGRATSAVHNVSSYVPTHEELAVLELGLNFNTGPASDKFKMICAVEHAIDSTNRPRPPIQGLLVEPRLPYLLSKLVL